MEIFGYEIIRKKEEEKTRSFVEPTTDDGSVNVTATQQYAGGVFGSTFLDLDGSAKNEAEVINKYRQMEQHAEVAKAVDDIVNEAIVVSEDNKVVEINLDDVDIPDRIKKLITEEFANALALLDFSNKGYDIFNRWYIDGRIRFHTVVDEDNPREGIQELRYVDPRKLRRIKEIEKKADKDSDIILKKVKNEYWLFNDKGFGNSIKTSDPTDERVVKGSRIAKDAIVEATSGILNENNTVILSHIHKAIKPYNQLRMLEDAVVIYRLARAPERRIFYIDVGNLPKAKAEQYLRDMMVKHKNRLVYDTSSGEIRDDRRHMSMLEDFWLPRREGGRGTEIDTLQGGENLGNMEDVLYFQKALYRALNVPITRMDAEANFTLGRASEVTRDEVKFAKFISRLRSRFSGLFDEILERQLILKNIMSIEEWKEIKNQIRYDFQEDNHFQQIKEIEILRERFQLLNDVEQFSGTYFSKEWIRKHVLFLSDEEIENMKKQMKKEKEEEPDEDPFGEDPNLGQPLKRPEPVKPEVKPVAPVKPVKSAQSDNPDKDSINTPVKKKEGAKQ